MMQRLIQRMVKGEDLSEAEMERAMGEILSGRATPAQMGAFFTSLRMKGETVEEITGAARALRRRVPRFNVNNHLVNLDREDINMEEETVLSACDTGSEGSRTFNVSTATALVAAGGGVKVVKHGTRSDARLVGLSSVLEHLGVRTDLSSAQAEASVRDVGIAFYFIPVFTGPMREVAGVRMEVGIRTILNLIGPLANPAGAQAHVLGVYEATLTEKMALVLKKLGAREAFVVHGEAANDEFSICGPTTVSHLRNGAICNLVLEPEAFGFKRATPDDIRGGNARDNARIVREILDGRPGPRRDMVLLNAGAAFMAVGLDPDLPSGISRAGEVIDSGRARRKLEELVRYASECAPFVRKEL